MWFEVEQGSTIGTKGSESGHIIRDEEHRDGARITLEEKTDIAPFAITCGVYGGFFHTVFLSSLEEGISKFDNMKSEISDFFATKSTTEQDNEWIENFVGRH